MQIKIISAAIFSAAMGCRESGTPAGPVVKPAVDSTVVIPQSLHIGEIPVPAGFTRVKEGPDSFGSWLRQVPLKKDKTVYLYNGSVKANQLAQYAVIDISTGKKDLQQCADVVMRLRAEYLFSQKKYKEIAFMDYSGKWYTWNNGGDRAAFDQYLQNVFGWCGSASLEKQLKRVNAFDEIQTGDVLVMGGFPGHAVTVIDMAISARGEKIFMLAQGYQPAQDMHVLVNMNEPGISPWYRIPEGEEVYTPEWTFKKTHLRRW
jgi:Domain of unknown function (4846)